MDWWTRDCRVGEWMEVDDGDVWVGGWVNGSVMNGSQTDGYGCVN